MERAFKDLCPGEKPDNSLALAVAKRGRSKCLPKEFFPQLDPLQEMLCESAASREAAKEFSPRRKAVSGLVGNRVSPLGRNKCYDTRLGRDARTRSLIAMDTIQHPGCL